MGEELASVAAWERACVQGTEGQAKPIDIRKIDVAEYEESDARARKQWEFWQRPLLDGGQGKQQRESSIDLPRDGGKAKKRNRRVRTKKKAGQGFRAVISHATSSNNNNKRARTMSSRTITSRGRSPCVQTKDPVIAKPVQPTVLESRVIISQEC